MCKTVFECYGYYGHIFLLLRSALNSCCPPPILPWSYILFPCNPFSVSTSRYLPTLLAKLPSSYRWLHLGGWQSVLHFIFVICCSPTSTNILLQFLSYHLDPMSTLFKIYCFLYCRSIIYIQSPLSLYPFSILSVSPSLYFFCISCTASCPLTFLYHLFHTCFTQVLHFLFHPMQRSHDEGKKEPGLRN